ncbi:MAG: type II toxin-antitoxin system VapC family toxin [Thermoproteota archaeon]
MQRTNRPSDHGLETAAVIRRVKPQIEEKAWEIFKKYQDKDFSFTDCTTFAMMEEEALSTAFTFDPHFQQYGFRMVP